MCLPAVIQVMPSLLSGPMEPPWLQESVPFVMQCMGTDNMCLQEKGFDEHNAYSLSKLAMMMITAEQAERLGQNPPTVNCLDPGTVNTKMLIAGWGACGISIEDANYELHLATSPDLATTSGAALPC